jgi:hypothetical protein
MFLNCIRTCLVNSLAVDSAEEAVEGRDNLADRQKEKT